MEVIRGRGMFVYLLVMPSYIVIFARVQTHVGPPVIPESYSLWFQAYAQLIKIDKISTKDTIYCKSQFIVQTTNLKSKI